MTRSSTTSLNESENRRCAATEAAGAGTWEHDLVSGRLIWDGRCKALFGLPPDAEATYEDTFLAGVHPDDRERARAALQAAIVADGAAYAVECRLAARGDGVVRWIAARGRAVRENGRAVRLTGLMCDITARKRAVERLEAVVRTGAALAAEHDRARIVEAIVDAGVELTGAQIGAFFDHAGDREAERHVVRASAAASRSASAGSSGSRGPALFAPTFAGEDAVRSDDVLRDPRHARSAALGATPEPLVRSYLAARVASLAGAHGALVFGHAAAGVFTEEHEHLLAALAGYAATAIENAQRVAELRAEAADLRGRLERVDGRARSAGVSGTIDPDSGRPMHDLNNLLNVIASGLNVMERTEDPQHHEIVVARMREAAARGVEMTRRLLASGRGR